MKNLFLILFLFPAFVKAQESPLMIAGTGNDLHLNHTAAPKENFYSIGRLYNISPKEIAPYNKLSMEGGLNIGQTIKIPLKAANFMQSGNNAADEVAVPVYHTVEPKETLYQLSAHYNKVPVASIKSWNNLSGDVLNPGQNVIIGYLKVKKDLSALAQKGTAAPVVKAAPAPAKETVVKEPAVKPEAVVKKEEPKTVKAEPKEEPVVVKEPVKKPQPVQSSAEGAGAFKTLYSNTGKEETGTAGVFKSTSGWEDGKYYCLNNSAPQGSVVKITNITTGKSVYAKVLDNIPDLKQNADLVVRLSNAAADALEAGTANFECKINY